MKNIFIITCFVLAIFFYTFVICNMSDDLRFLRRRVCFLEKIQSSQTDNLIDLLDILNKR